MTLIWTLIKKELRASLTSPMIYVLTGLFALIVGWTFFNLLITYVESLQNLPENLIGTTSFVQSVIFRLFGNINFMLIFICPLVTMRSISEEKKQHSLEFLLVSPVSNLQIILSKFLSSLLMICLILSSSFIFPIIIKMSGFDVSNYMLNGFAGIFFTAAMFVSIGILASSLTENQIVAALLSVVMILFLWMVAWASQSTSNYYLVDLYKYLGYIDHFESFVKGIINTSDIVYFLSIIYIGLHLSVKVLDSRNW
jgi:ABC-2 type transport system permease protein